MKLVIYIYVNLDKPQKSGLEVWVVARSKKPSRVDIFKGEICDHFLKYIDKNNLTQLALAKKLKLNTALMSKIMRHQFDEFSIDRLLKLLEKIRPDLTPTLKKTRPKSKK